MNKVILLGNVTKDIESTTTNGGVEVARFTLAVQRKYQNSNGEKETDFINCVAWRKTAEVISKYVKKGNKLGVVGNIQTRTYDATDGSKRYVTEVVVDEVEFLTYKKDEKEEKEEVKLVEIDDENLPF